MASQVVWVELGVWMVEQRVERGPVGRFRTQHWEVGVWTDRWPRNSAVVFEMASELCCGSCPAISAVTNSKEVVAG